MKKINRNMIIVLILILLIIIITSIVYATNYNKSKLTPTMASGNEKLWVGTFQLVWNELMEKNNGPIEFVGGNSEIVNELNKRGFTKDMLSDKDYYICLGEMDLNLRDKIQKDLSEKFGYTDNTLNQLNWKTSNKNNDLFLYSNLKKQFTFVSPFKYLEDNKFNNSNNYFKYFGIEGVETNSNYIKAKDNIEVLFYSYNDFAVKLKTNEGEEIYLYRTDSTDSFENIYNKMLEKANNYAGSNKFEEMDKFMAPYININENISYDELCNKQIKGVAGKAYIRSALQSLQFNLNEMGGNVSSQSSISYRYASDDFDTRYFEFKNTYVLFMKEKSKEKPYLAIKVDDSEFLVPKAY